jgi:acetyltransferase-like isoleucine patch superfamily enzyme
MKEIDVNIIKKIKRLLILKRIKKANKSLKHIMIGDFSISHIENFIVKDGCRIGDGCMINAGGGLEMGHNVILAPNVVIWTQNHNFINASMLPYDSGIKNKKVTIGSNCWFGEGVKIAPGVTIGEGVILAMGSVVFDDIPPFAIAMGNPAVVKSIRKDIEKYRSLDINKHSYILNKLKSSN